MATNSTKKLIKNMSPELLSGDFVFVTVTSLAGINTTDIHSLIREKEGFSLILEKDKADDLGLSYDFVASWITLNVFSALDDVGLTAAFSNALSEENISCNVVAGYHHDHIFVAKEDAEKSMVVLKKLSSS